MTCGETIVLLIGALLVIVAIAAIVAFRQTIPSGKLGYDGSRFYQPGTQFIFRDISLIEMGEVVDTVETTKKQKLIVVWRPDPENMNQFMTSGVTSMKIAEILSANPATDLKKYEKSLGILVISVEKSGKDESGNSAVDLGGGVEVPY